jgi:NAD(P) transhydrogenase subunit beta
MTALDTTLSLAYLATGILFIIGLKLLSSPARARTGNWLAGAGMVLAVAATAFDSHIISWNDILIGGALGAPIGYFSARAVKMTAMPQMVALFNGAGGGAAALVAGGDFLRAAGSGAALGTAAVIGAISFAGSLVAFAKLQELMTGRPVTYAGQQVVNMLVALGIIATIGYMLAGNATGALLGVLAAMAALLGVLAVLPIGGADMPVVISLLNSLTGVAVAVTGFVLNNSVLIISGTLVGASGTLLTMLMAKAMNRSLGNVLFGAFGAVQASSGAAAAQGTGSVRSASVEDVATLLAYARSVIIVPGYGMAVAQAQHADLRHADLRRRPRATRHRLEAQHEPGICRHRQPALRKSENRDALRRRQDQGQRTGHDRKQRIAAAC